MMVTGESMVGFTLFPNTADNPGSGSTIVTTSWTSLHSGRGIVRVYAYFSSPTSALVHQDTANTMDIPSAAVRIKLNDTGSFNPLTHTCPFAGSASCLQIDNIDITATNKTGGATESLKYSIDTTVVPQLPPDTYSGILNIQVQVLP
jgi:hypothetical protein